MLDAAWEHFLKAIGKKGKWQGSSAQQRRCSDFGRTARPFHSSSRSSLSASGMTWTSERSGTRSTDHRRLRAADMPFVRAMPSLLHLLLNFGFDCAKPDSVVRRMAEDAGLLGEPQGDAELWQLVEVIQRYSVARDVRPGDVDFHCLVAGNQRWARQFIQPKAL